MTHTSLRSMCLGALLLGTVATSACASSQRNLTPIRLAEISDPQTLRPPMIIELREGDRLPLDLFIHGDYLELENTEETPIIVVRRPVFVHIDGRHPPQFSTDGEDVGNLGGSVEVGLGASEERGGSFARIGVTVIERE